ncbi:MAG: hypothetical protein Unbinned3818contig1000_4 [Prokaryotic dsDNA virus sp.]|nr:hypothetical protein [Phycisphaerae bacterium]QDP45933.1 MAG: hypothetical protein Unbinned3818contig1000_4 [Prokaryotic dsDNA virus sp.]|tara:strand:+ start:550 stop:804 length:255 start_codon:yes stop_codon:yes gene_type:complete
MSEANEVQRVVMCGFQPIETAPKDGTEVVLRFVCHDGDDRPVEILNGWFDGSWRRICHNSNSYQYFSFGEVTHWMPIPEINSNT